MAHTVILRGRAQRMLAQQLIAVAPDNAVVTIRPEKRSLDQNAKMWAMLSDVSRAKPDGRTHTPEAWKRLFMHACGWSSRFEEGLNGEYFPTGFESSKLTKEEMSTLIEFIYAYGTQRGVEWSEPAIEDAA